MQRLDSESEPCSAQNYRWSALVLGVIKSAPFQMRRVPDAEPAAAAGGSRQ